MKDLLFTKNRIYSFGETSIVVYRELITVPIILVSINSLDEVFSFKVIQN
jgi:hypothetical protein